MSRIIPLLAAATLLALVSACGGSSPGSKTPAASTPGATTTSGSGDANHENEFAKSMVLRLFDFPVGYIETPDASNDTDNVINVTCAEPTEIGRTGRAVSRGYSAATDAPSILETVFVFQNEDAARAWLDAVDEQVACAVKTINDGKLNTANIGLFGATSSRIDIDAGGDAASSHIVRADSITTGQATSNVTLISTLVYARKGRVGYRIGVIGRGFVLDPAEVASYAQKAASKIRQQP